VAGAVDHCTAFPDRIFNLDLSACCAGHDDAFAKGGDLKAFLAANLNLDACVSALGDHPVFAALLGMLMLVGTTLCGLPWWFKARRKG
jgi:hypothetical protein